MWGVQPCLTPYCRATGSQLQREEASLIKLQNDLQLAQEELAHAREVLVSREQHVKEAEAAIMARDKDSMARSNEVKMALQVRWVGTASTVMAILPAMHSAGTCMACVLTATHRC
jgi:hypothetical protein